MRRLHLNTLLALIASLIITTGATAQQTDERRKLQWGVLPLLLMENFSELERLSAEYRAAATQSEAGTRTLGYFYDGVNQAVKSLETAEPYWAMRQKQLDAWLGKYPASPSAQLAQAALSIQHAWTYRGDRPASEVKREHWAPFERYIEEARDRLIKYKPSASVDPHWYVLMLTVAKAQAWDGKRYDALVDEATTRHPFYYPIYFSAIEYLLPKWHGDKESVEDFANLAAARTRSRDGDTMYARVYWAASEGYYLKSLFKESSVNWPRMKKGLNEILRQQDSPRNINAAALFACLARDKDMTAQLIPRIDSPLIEIWGASLDPPDKAPAGSFDACSRFARQ